MSMKFTIVAPRTSAGTEPTIEVEADVLPKIGEYVSHDPSGIYGTVTAVQYWWPEDGGEMVIEVRVK